MKQIGQTLKYLLLSSLLFISSCKTVPLTGRSQLRLIPSSTMLSISTSQYRDFIKSHPLSRNRKATAMVKRVGKRIQHAVEKFMRAKGLQSELKDYHWEFNLVKSKEANAWAMPGGKVVVYSGILKYTKNEQGLAVVLGHEISHAIAHHGEERASQELARSAGGLALSAVLKNKSASSKKLWLTAYGVGTQFGVMLPFSRSHESEADHLGLIFMSMAGYDPHAAPKFWQDFSNKGRQSVPEFFSTHPSNQTRIKDLKSWIPEAMKYYRKK